METIYTSGEYLKTTETWHAEDSPWKANQIIEIICNNHLQPKTIAEIGCGAGAIIARPKEKIFPIVVSPWLSNPSNKLMKPL
jgi:hypothetical protein